MAKEKHISKKNELDYLKNNPDSSLEILNACNNAKECFIDNIGPHEIELVCERKLFNFPVYTIDLNKMYDGRVKKLENGEIVDFNTIFSEKLHRDTLITRINDFQMGNIDLGTNIQQHKTPEKVVDMMLPNVENSLSQFSSDHFWVFFNLEFLESLVYTNNVNRKRITFFTDNIIKAKWAMKMFNVQAYIINTDEFLNQTGPAMPKSEKIIVVGNPPYQVTNNKSDDQKKTNHASPLYQKYVEAVIDFINPSKLIFIIPSRWMIGGRGLETHRTRMMNDTRLRKIVHFPNPKDVFQRVDVTGGVNYFVWDSNYNGPCEFNDGTTTAFRQLNEFDDVVVQDNKAINIIKKCHSECYMNKEFSGQASFDIVTSFTNWSDEGTKCIGKDREIHFISENYYTDKFNIKDKWKVITTKADGGAYAKDTNGSVKGLNKQFIIEPGTICTQTYIVMNVFDSENEAKNFLSYSTTKLFKFLLGIKTATPDINKEKFSFVPDQLDYTRSYDDEYLYKKYNLSAEEMSHIESKIKD